MKLSTANESKAITCVYYNFDFYGNKYVRSRISIILRMRKELLGKLIRPAKIAGLELTFKLFLTSDLKTCVSVCVIVAPERMYRIRFYLFCFNSELLGTVLSSIDENNFNMAATKNGEGYQFKGLH